MKFDDAGDWSEEEAKGFRNFWIKGEKRIFILLLKITISDLSLLHNTLVSYANWENENSYLYVYQGGNELR